MKRNRSRSGASVGGGKLDQRVPPYMPLVPWIAGRLCQEVAEPSQLRNLSKDGIAGLIAAAEAYSPQSRVPYRVYVKCCIKAAMLDGLQSRLVSATRLPAQLDRAAELTPKRTARQHATKRIDRTDTFLLSLLGLQRSTESFDDRHELLQVTAGSPERR